MLSHTNVIDRSSKAVLFATKTVESGEQGTLSSITTRSSIPAPYGSSAPPAKVTIAQPAFFRLRVMRPPSSAFVQFMVSAVWLCPGVDTAYSVSESLLHVPDVAALATIVEAISAVPAAKIARADFVMCPSSGIDVSHLRPLAPVAATISAASIETEWSRGFRMFLSSRNSQVSVKDGVCVHVETGDHVVVIDVPHRRPDRAGRIELGQRAIARADVAVRNAVCVQIHPSSVTNVVDAAFSTRALHGIRSVVYDEGAIGLADQGMQHV